MWINLVCGGIVGIMVLITAFMIARLEMIRKAPQATTKQAKIIAIIAGIVWLLIFFLTNDGWNGGGFTERMGIFTALLLVMPYISFLRLWLCLRLDKSGNKISPKIINLEKWEGSEVSDHWYAKYEYLGEYKGKRKVYPTMQVLEAQYAQSNETAEEAEGAIAAALPNATVRYLERHPNIHRFEYDEPEVTSGPRRMQIGLHEKGFLRNNWKTLIVVLVAAFLGTVVLIGAKMWLDRNDLITKAEDGWTKTELILEEGQCVRLEPFGTVRISETEGYNGEINPAGWQTLCLPNDAGECMLNDAPYGALIARFGNGEPFILDEKIKVSVTDNGPLWLAVNDNEQRVDDNSGHFRVKIQVLDKACD